ncbi:MAG: hypothetical protein GXO49_08225, partial [Chlorobi bacterium]|nr:hypothetical protein [Chlorobiota bacterium]
EKYVKSQVWNKIVKNYALSGTYEELGIDVSGMELAKIISGENIQTGLDPLTKQIFSNKNGQFDAKAAVNFFTNASETERGMKIATFLENEMKDNRKFTKYISLIQKGINTTTFEAKQAYLERTKLVDFNYAVKKYREIADSTINVSDADLEAYYSEHKNEYEQKKSRDIAYVTYKIVPSEEDKQATKKDLEYYKNEFKEIDLNNFEEVVNYVNANSTRKFYFPHLSSEEVKDSALFYASSDTVFGPTYENGAYTMKRVFDRKVMADSVDVRHILIQPDGQVIKDMDRAKEIADSLLTLIKGGADFAELAKDNSIYRVTAEKGGDLGMLTEAALLNQLGNEFSDACFSSKKGDLKVIETKYGYHVAEIKDFSKDKKEKVRVAAIYQEVRPGNTTVNNYFTQARDFSAEVGNSIQKFDELVAKKGLTKRIANNIEPSTEVIAGIENSSPIINWIYKDDTKKGTVSSPFQDGDMFIVAIVTEVREDGIAPLELVKDRVTAEVIKSKKGEKLSKEMANVTDLPKLAKNISFVSSRLNNDGIEYKVIATAVYTDKDKVTKPIKGENGVYVLKVTSITGGKISDDVDLSNDKNNAQRMNYFRINREMFEAIKEAADVEDYRYKFM